MYVHKEKIISLLKLSKSLSSDPRLVVPVPPPLPSDAPLPLARIPPPTAPPPPALGGGPRSKSNKSIRTSSCFDAAVAVAPSPPVAPEADVTVVAEPPVAVAELVEELVVAFVEDEVEELPLGGGGSPKMAL